MPPYFREFNATALSSVFIKTT